MYAKSFIVLNGNGRLTGARNAQTVPYDHYTCHLCGSTLQYHPEYDTERPWFEHTANGLTENGQHHCPYVNPDARQRSPDGETSAASGTGFPSSRTTF